MAVQLDFTIQLRYSGKISEELHFKTIVIANFIVDVLAIPEQ